MTIGTHSAKVLSWYDNEWGYSSRVVDLIDRVRWPRWSTPETTRRSSPAGFTCGAASCRHQNQVL